VDDRAEPAAAESAATARAGRNVPGRHQLERAPAGRCAANHHARPDPCPSPARPARLLDRDFGRPKLRLRPLDVPRSFLRQLDGVRLRRWELHRPMIARIALIALALTAACK